MYCWLMLMGVVQGPVWCQSGCNCGVPSVPVGSRAYRGVCVLQDNNHTECQLLPLLTHPIANNLLSLCVCSRVHAGASPAITVEAY